MARSASGMRVLSGLRWTGVKDLLDRLVYL